jgi:hypothetical protein
MVRRIVTRRSSMYLTHRILSADTVLMLPPAPTVRPCISAVLRPIDLNMEITAKNGEEYDSV